MCIRDSGTGCHGGTIDPRVPRSPRRTLRRSGGWITGVTANQPGLAGPGALAGSGPASVPTQPAWPAPVADCPVAAVVRLPGSKSVTNRALVLAALAGGRSVLTEPLRSRDTLLMAAGLRALGVPVRAQRAGSWMGWPGHCTRPRPGL